MSNENENLIFHLHLLNTNISVTNTDKSLKFSRTVLSVGFEGSVFQVLYLGPSFYFMLCVFLRQAFLERNLKNTHTKFQFNNLSSNREIYVQKIKVKNSFFNLSFL